MARISLIVLALLALAGLVFGIWGCQISNGQNFSREQVINSQFMVISRADMADTDIARLPEDFQEKATTLGWKRVDGGFECVGPGAGITITDGVSTVVTDSSGYFCLAVANRNGQMQAVVGDVRLPLDRSSVQSRDGTGLLTIRVPFYSCCGPGDACTLMSSQVVTRAPMDGRCLDYNGWWSNGQNYGKNDWRAFRNFVASDCDRAFFRAGCWSDHYRGGCWNVHGEGGCSRAIGHSWSYHKHNYPN